MSAKKSTKTSPLLVRPGAQYTCFGDGLCCTDIHGIGPLTKKEVKSLKSLDPDSAGWDEHHDDHMMRTAADGGCMFLLEDQRCGIHAERGPDAKPEGCRRFPLGLVATPNGGRITTDHRCSCRTLGERPDIDPEEARESLLDADAQLDVDRYINKIPLKSNKRIPFSEWEKLEEKLLSRLMDGEEPEAVLDAKPFCALEGTSWKEQALEFIGSRDGTQFGLSLAWVGDTIRHLLEDQRVRQPHRPWAAAFDRAEKRATLERQPRDIYADWIADEIWGLKWAEDHDFAKARKELSTRLAIARDIAGRIEALGHRPDRAAAEAVTIVETVGESDFWEEVRDHIA